MSQSFWWTLSTFDFLCPPHEWIRAILSCGIQCRTVQTGIISKHWFYWRRSWRLKIDFRWILCMFRSHTFLPTSRMCKKQTSVSHSSKEAEIISLDTVVRAWMEYPLSIIGYWSFSFFLQSKTKTRRVSAGRPAAQQAVKQTHHHPNQDSVTERRSWVVHCRSCLRKREILSSCCHALHILKDNEANDKNDHEKQESNDETRVPNPQSCVGLVVRQN